MDMPAALRINAYDAALQCLIDCGASSLPVDVKGIVKASAIKLIRDSAVCVLDEHENGAYYYDYVTGSRFIVYNDKLSIEWQRFVIAHELAHGILRHET